ncbi:MAG: TIGR01212 family radical SAM protein [Acidobacteria bacterium]|nr:TIGR01212 family radical SAM protein [Acidobacteriota bacterium]
MLLMSDSQSRIPNLESRMRYNPYSRFLKEKFGCRVYKVSVDAGFSCPNRDGTVGVGGCTYCNNDSFRARSANRLKPVSEQVSTGIEFLRKHSRADKFIVYFQPFTNTHAPLDKLIPMYEAAVGHPDVVGISLGTRPDCVDEEKIAWLEKLARTHFVTLEYGLQSIYDSTLSRINRGHDFKCWLDAMRRTRDRGIWLCTHLILGFPWETREEMLRSADVLSGQGLNVLKLHHLHIVRNTAMEREYLSNPFPLPGLQEYAELVVDFLERLDPAIYIERLFGTAPREQLIEPIWGKSKAEIRACIERRFEERDTYQGRKSSRQSAVGSGQ